MAPARIYPWRRMRRSRVPSNGPGRFIGAQFSAGVNTNMSAFDFRQAHLHFAPQNNQLMSERGILSLKPGVRLEWRGQDGQDEPDEPDHRGNLADSSLNKPELGFRYTQEAGIDYQGRTHDEHT